MNLDEATRWRDVIGKVAALFFVLFFLSAMDGLVAVFRQPVNVFSVLSGETVEVNGPLKEKPSDISQLTYVSSSDQITLSFQAVHSGFWMGGIMWRGVIAIGPEVKPGDYRVEVGLKGDFSQKPSSTFTFRVYQNYETQRLNSLSLMRRYFDLSPWWVFGVFFLLTLLCIGTVYLCSQKREFLLRQEGKAEVYHIVKNTEGCEISFALGTEQGVQAGAKVTILDGSGMPIGSASVRTAYDGDSTASVTPGCEVEEGYIVVINR